MITMFGIMKAFVESSDWDHEVVQEGSVLRFAMNGDNGSWMCIALTEEELKQCVVMSYVAGEVEERYRPAMAEYITRANYGMRIGNFEMDMEDGDLRFRTSIDVADENLTPEVFRQLVIHNATQFDRYLPGIEAVLRGEQPKQAVAAVEDES
jgi:hypothetical protein